MSNPRYIINQVIIEMLKHINWSLPIDSIITYNYLKYAANMFTNILSEDYSNLYYIIRGTHINQCNMLKDKFPSTYKNNIEWKFNSIIASFLTETIKNIKIHQENKIQILVDDGLYNKK